MTPTDYSRLRGRLDAPTPTVIDDVTEFLHPHEPAEGSWADLSFTARIWCCITAIELALPVVESLLRQRALMRHQARAPRDLLERLQDALAGDAGIDDVDWALQHLLTVVPDAHAQSPGLGLLVETVRMALGRDRRNVAMSELIADALELVWDVRHAQGWPGPRRWWARCRCRLAFADVGRDTVLPNRIRDALIEQALDRSRSPGVDSHLAPGTRGDAVLSLGRIADEPSWDALRRLRVDPDPAVARLAREALESVADESANLMLADMPRLAE